MHERDWNNVRYTLNYIIFNFNKIYFYFILIVIIQKDKLVDAAFNFDRDVSCYMGCIWNKTGKVGVYFIIILLK